MRNLRTSLGLASATVLLLAACAAPGTSPAPGGTPAGSPGEPPAGSPAGSPAASPGESPAGSPAASPPGSPPASPGQSPSGELAPVQLQLQWEPQAQFAGYFAADRERYYAEEGLQVEFLRGGSEIIPQNVGSDPNGPEFTISWVPKVLEVRANNVSDLVNIAQVFQRSGTRSVSWAAGAGPDPTSDENITSPEQFEGKNIGVWDFGNEYEVTAAGKLHGLEPDVDYTKVIQPFNMDLLLNREVDVAEAMIYNEYAQVLETENPKTGDLYQPEDLNVIDYNEVGTAMLQDAIFARQAWLDEEGNEDVATRFLRASFRGWMFCRDNQDRCIEYTVDAGSTLPAGHQAWMMNEINPLIWPSPEGIGQMPVDFWEQTVEVSIGAEIIPDQPDEGAYRTDLAEAAREGIDGDVNGADFQKGEVEVTPGGN
ncbi:MAG: ABC transporter substrate-binding protein [Chloroflexota bacterium]|nr:ABC transporter substrate-binding protein [Chloroflexota bacterium]